MRISQVPAYSFRYHTTVSDPGGGKRVRQFSLLNTLSAVFQYMNTVDLSSIVNISGLNPFTLADCGLITPAGGFTYFVTAISAPYGNRLDCLPLPVPDFNRLEHTSFAWRTHKTFDTTMLKKTRPSLDSRVAQADEIKLT